MNHSFDVIIIGAGAAGMICASEAGKRGRRVLLLDHAEKIAEKIRLSGGGRCNFTNLHARAENYLSGNRHFCKSALAQYGPQDFITLLQKHKIAFHEKKLGQLFCDKGAEQIIDMLQSECAAAGVVIKNDTSIEKIETRDSDYHIRTNRGEETCASLVIATGGLSIPKIGATKFGHDIARQFDLSVTEMRPALVPLTFQASLLDYCKNLSGVSLDADVSCGKKSFSDGLLFTHRGLSGPSILQVSSLWREGMEIKINLAPQIDILSFLLDQKDAHPKQDIQTILSTHLPKRLAASICDAQNVTGRIADLSRKKLETLARAVNDWRITPAGTEGYNKAEVTLGGVDTKELSSKTMESKKHPGLYFIGEVVDVTGQLGGFNLQWSWSSGYVAGQHV